MSENHVGSEHVVFGKLISVEGLDGAGKTTRIVPYVAKWMAENSIDGFQSADLNTTPLSKLLRTALLSDEIGKTLSPQNQALLTATARLDWIDRVVKPAITSGLSVVSDRFVATTYVYQYRAPRLMDLIELGAGGMVADLTFLCVCSYETARARLPTRPGFVADHFERFSEEEFNERLRRYYEYMKNWAGDTQYVVLNTDLPEEEVQSQIDRVLQQLFFPNTPATILA